MALAGRRGSGLKQGAMTGAANINRKTKPMTRTTKHPGKSPAQRRVLDEIGCGNYIPRMSPATRKTLLDKGLIEPCGEMVICRDRFGTVSATEFQMPIPVHYQWCKFWSENHD
jgi:hypothetical protein